MTYEPNKFFQMRDSDGSFVAAVDALRALERPIPSRAAMLRRLVNEKVASAVSSKIVKNKY